jgi:hypothetical protein
MLPLCAAKHKPGSFVRTSLAKLGLAGEREHNHIALQQSFFFESQTASIE